MACQRARLFTEHRRAPASAELIFTPAAALDDIPCNATRVLIDAGPMDTSERCDQVPPAAIVLTHYHADHVQGLFHMRWGCGAPIPVFGPRDRIGCADLYKNPGLLSFQRPLRALQPFTPVDTWTELTIIPVPLRHSKPTFGYCIDGPNQRLAYLTDTCGLPEATERFLRQRRPDIVVLDATYPHNDGNSSNHNDVDQAVEILERLKPTQGWLTHLGCEIDTAALLDSLALPANVGLAADRQVFTI